MIALRSWRERASPDPSELLSLEERHGYLAVLRAGLASMVLAAVVLAPEVVVGSVLRIVGATVGYLAVSAGPVALRRDRRFALPLIQGALLLDGIYLAAVVSFTGGAVSPLLFLVFVWVSWSVPRVRIDQILNIGWKRLIPLALLAIIIAAAFVALGPALGGIR